MLQNRLWTIANYDFSPRWSQRLRHRLASPLGVLLLAGMVAVLIGLTLHHRVFVLAGGLFGVAMLGVCWPWITMFAVRAELAFTIPRTTENCEVQLVLTIANHLPWPVAGLIVRGMGPSTNVPTVAGRSRTQCRWLFRPEVRGEYPQAPVEIVTSFPFGLWESRRRVAIESTLMVWPRTFAVGPVPLNDAAESIDGSMTRNKVGTTGDSVGVRPYRRGDSPRRIHWTQSARHDRLIVCELQAYSRPIILLLLDVDPAIHTLGAEGSREWAIRIAASFAQGWLNAGAQVGLAVGSLLLPPRSGTAHLTKLMDALARISDNSVSLAQVLALPGVRAQHDTLQVIISTDIQRSPIPDGSSRWAVLQRNGFGSTAKATNQTIRKRPWLTIPSADQVAQRLRHGTTEASHGS